MTPTLKKNFAPQSVSPSPFRGWLTQLLHEAFYLEDFEENTSSLGPNPDEKTFVEEDEVEQFEFLKQFLGSHQWRLN